MQIKGYTMTEGEFLGILQIIPWTARRAESRLRMSGQRMLPGYPRNVRSINKKTWRLVRYVFSGSLSLQILFKMSTVFRKILAFHFFSWIRCQHTGLYICMFFCSFASPIGLGINVLFVLRILNIISFKQNWSFNLNTPCNLLRLLIYVNGV